MDLSRALDIFLNIVAVALTFGLAVFVHELGHYLFARLRGVGVEKFAIGMGPVIVAWTVGETEYSLRWLPIGGFVKLHQIIREEADEEALRQEKLAGMAVEEQGGAIRENNGAEQPKTHVHEHIDETDMGIINAVTHHQEHPEKAAVNKPKSLGELTHNDAVALYNKGFLTKLLVFGGGVFFNFLTAIVAAAIIYSVGFDQYAPREVWLGSLKNVPELEAAGFRQGDRIIHVEGTDSPVEDEEDLALAVLNAQKKGLATDGLNVTVKRDGQTLALAMPPLPAGETDEAEAALKKFWEKFPYDFAPVIGPLLPSFAAEKAGLKEGDRVLAVNEKPINSWEQMAEVIRVNMDQAVLLTVERKGEPKPVNIAVVPQEDKNKPGTGMIGIQSGGAKVRVQEPVLKAIAMAPGRTWGTLVAIVKLNVQVIRTYTFGALKDNVGGPVAIAKMTYQHAEKGFVDLMQWFMSLNLILAVMNLLPIPVLDGGFIVLSFIEAVLRRPVSQRILTPVYTFFALCFIALMVLVSFQDIKRTLF